MNFTVLKLEKPVTYLMLQDFFHHVTWKWLEDNYLIFQGLCFQRICHKEIHNMISEYVYNVLFDEKRKFSQNTLNVDLAVMTKL